MRQFIYDENDKLNGMLHFLSDKYPTKYNQLVTASADSMLEGHGPNIILNFTTKSTTVYASHPNVERDATVTICFTSHLASLTGFSLNPGVGHCRLQSFNFAGKVDQQSELYYPVSYTHSFQVGDIQHFDWNYGPFRCFAIAITGDSFCSNQYQRDIRNIEFFGKLTRTRLFIDTCKKRQCIPYILLLMFLIDLNE